MIAGTIFFYKSISIMNLQQFLSEKAKNSATGFSIEGRAKAKTLLFGTEKLQETPAEFLFYRFFQVLFQVATALLLGYGFFSFFQEPLTTAYPAQGYTAAVVVSSLFVVGYEIAKFFALRRGLRHLIYAIREDWTFIGSAVLPLIVGIALCYGSWLGANKGAEHIAAAKTDLAPVIQQDVKAATTSAEAKYEADKKALTTEHNTNISQARKALASYQSSGKWQNPQTVQALTASVEAAKRSKEKELSELELAHKGTTAKIEADAAPKLEANSSKQSLYQECIFFGSIFLEWGVVVLIFLIMWSIHGTEAYVPKPSTQPNPQPQPQTPTTPVAPVAPVKPVTSPLPIPVHSGAGTSQKKTDDPVMIAWKNALNFRAVLLNRYKEYHAVGKDTANLDASWIKNEDKLLEACEILGIEYPQLNTTPEPQPELV
jgi:hypothetical protein